MKRTVNRALVITLAMMITISMSISAFAASRCLHSGCNNKTVSGSNYCSTHKCKKSGCGSAGLNKYNGYCSTSHKPSSTSNKSTKTNSSSSKVYSSKSKYTMPDCDDYEDYDDFMDDWDGCMPDGSDAEDYWENW